MGLTLGINTFALSTVTDLNQATQKLGKTMERLSSGLRIATASDDPAGLAIADSLRTDARIASVAIKNVNDGLSIISVADAGLEQISTSLTRMSELAEQSANGVYTNSQRSAMSSEFLALGSEIERIAVTTTFNGINLLSNSSNITLQVGLGAGPNNQIFMGSVVSTLTSLGLATSDSSALKYSIIANGTDVFSQSAAQNALDAVQSAISHISAFRGVVGASQSRLNIAVQAVTVARENFIAAESRIRDVDVAEEVAEMTRLKVLQQAGTAVLAQANEIPQTVMSLLG